MGRIQSTVGLITGVPIADTVDQLISVSARPRDILLSRTQQLQTQQVAIGELTARVIGIQIAAKRLGQEEIFNNKDVASSREDLLTATVTGDPPEGTNQFTPVRQAQTHQLVSSGFASLEEPVGSGSLRLQYGGFVDSSLDLGQLNAGAGVERGKIRITDRSGSSATIDLRFAQTVDDVISAINRQESINVQATVAGDQIRLDDLSGQTGSNLRVQEVSGGTTATDLGLAGIDVAASSATGTDLVALYESLRISKLNDGNGVTFQNELTDLVVSLADGSQLEVDFQANSQEQSLGDLLNTINSVDPAKLTAQISADGERLELTDLTSGANAFQVSSAHGGSTAEDLGLTGPATGNSLTSRRLVGGLSGPLLSSLQGGQGGQLGVLNVTDRAGNADSVDLSAAETLEDVIDLLNGSSAQIQASINQSRNGIEIRDVSGGSANLIVADADATQSATLLGVNANLQEDVIQGDSLNLQYIHEGTNLDELNAGAGVSLGSFLITDSSGAAGAVNLNVTGAKTVGDVLDEINGLGIGVEARINDSGDGIVLVDTAGGSSSLTVADTGNGTAAAELGISGTGSDISNRGATAHGIDGAGGFNVTFDADDTLSDVVEKINGLDAGVSASILQDGSDTPFRLSLVSNRAGRDGEVLIDTSDVDFTTQEIVSAQDALVLIGSLDSPGAGLLASSSSNQFSTLIDGVEIEVNGTSDQPVSITVSRNEEAVVSSVQLLVDSYNNLVDTVEELTFFNDVDSTTGILFGSHEVLRVEADLSRLLTGRFGGMGSIASVESLGISFNDQGRLEFDAERLQSAYAADSAAVREFFTSAEQGFAARLDETIDQLAGEGNSLLISRNDALQRRIEDNQQRIETLNARLDRERETLLWKFFRLEEAIAKMQANLSSAQALQGVPPIA